MEFKDKLPILRRERGLSQEALGEIIGISRQAVTKWELGQGYPDIDNLIKLSNTFKTSIDRLVKEEESDYFLSNIIKDTSCIEEIIEFLLKAKTSTYSAYGPRSAPSRPQSQDLHFSEGDYLYIDTYIGAEQFGGEEAVWYQGKPVWCMNFTGRLLSDNFSGDFLKESLRHITKDAPYRGPALYQSGDYTYHCYSTGSFEWFQGHEEIYCRSVKIYELVFHGGKLK
jgi:transcriptional regulator with XRE-family HTH domain